MKKIIWFAILASLCLTACTTYKPPAAPCSERAWNKTKINQW